MAWIWQGGQLGTSELVGDDQGKLEIKTEGDCESGHPLDDGSIWFSIDWLGTTRWECWSSEGIRLQVWC
jgi:hypothetical protein